MHDVYASATLAELKTHLASQSTSEIRQALIAHFLQHCCYENADQWNKAVRLCEALAIVGWGEHEPVQAVRGRFFNGNPETAFFNRYSQRRYVDAIWSKRKTGLTMEQGRTVYHASPDLPGKAATGDDTVVVECIQDIPLLSQRNWIPKNPISIGRVISNCYPESEAFVERVKELQVLLDERMAPEQYGSAIDRIIIRYHLSHASMGSKTNFIILDEDIGISTSALAKRLSTMHTAQEIKENGYFLRKRHDFGNFSRARGRMKIDLRYRRAPRSGGAAVGCLPGQPHHPRGENEHLGSIQVGSLT